MAFVEDLTSFFTDFGVPATTPSGTITVIFDAAFTAVLLDSTDSVGPSVVARSSDVSGLVYGSVLGIAGSSYSVTAIQPDGTGITTLQLRKV